MTTTEEKKKSEKGQKPVLKIEFPEAAPNCSFHLDKASLEALEQYSGFLSKHHNSVVSESRVIESLISRLSKDKLFRKWKKDQGIN